MQDVEWLILFEVSHTLLMTVLLVFFNLFCFFGLVITGLPVALIFFLFVDF